MNSLSFPSIEEMCSTHKSISPYIHHTVVITSGLINEIAEAELFFKCENFQKVGAFKMRGATNAILQLTESEKRKGVVTHSSGNHAQALALAAQLFSVKATIVMPSNAPQVKIAAVRDYGTQIEFCEPNLQAREQTVLKIQEQTGAVFIHPYNNYHIITGQATAAKELIEEIKNLDYIVAPVGGGGLLSGTALAAKYFSPPTKVIGAEPEGADDAYRSLQTGELIEQHTPDTIADGLLTTLGDKTFAIIKQNVDRIFTVSDEEIVQAMKLTFERLKIVIEPSAAVPLAVVLKNKSFFHKKKVGIIISGGNVDCNKLPFKIIDSRE